MTPIAELYGEWFFGLWEKRGFIFLAIGAFAVGTALGILNPEQVLPLIQEFREFVRTLAGKGPVELALVIFLRNASIGLLGILLGVLFGVVPLLAAVSNGLLLGALFQQFPTEIWKILPHGIFELPAIFITWGLGIWCGQWWSGPGKAARAGRRLKESLRIFFGICIPLLVIAAVIEVTGIFFFVGG